LILYEATYMTTQKKPRAFILFQLLKSEDQQGVNLPNAALVRMSEGLTERLMSTALDVEADFFRRADLNVSADDISWLSVVAFDREGKLAAVEGWYDPQVDKLIYAGDSQNMEDVEYEDRCEVFNGEGVPVSFLTLEKYGDRMLLAAGGETNSHWNLRTICEEWAHVAQELGEEAKESETQADIQADNPHVVNVLLGEAACGALDAGEYGNNELRHSLTSYAFATKAEADAFAKGLSEGAGWMEIDFPDADDVAKIEAAHQLAAEPVTTGMRPRP
jgi:hypothetical protein